MEKNIIYFISGLFILGALLLFLARLLGSPREKVNEIWQLFSIQLGIISAVLIPFFIGGYVGSVCIALFLIRGWGELVALFSRQNRFPYKEQKFWLISCLLPIGPFLIQEGDLAWPYLLGYMISLGALSTFFWGKSSWLRAFLSFSVLGSVTLGFLYLAGQPEAFSLLFLVYVITESFDSFAFVVGKLWGRHKVFPRLSPGKTWQGILGGLLAVALVSVGLNMFIYHLPWGQILIIALSVVSAGFLGDLGTSALKRSFGQKDFVAVHKVHGGVLDIYDALGVGVIAFVILHLSFFG